MEELNESKTPEVLESRAAVEEFELKEVSLANAAAQKPKSKKNINWVKVGVAGTLACSVLSLGLSCAALIKKSTNNDKSNDQSTNVSHGESYSVSEDGYLVIDGVKTDVKIGSTSDIIDAEIVPVDKWGIETFIKFTFDDGSYMTTTPKTQIMNDHYYDVSSAADIQALTTYGAPKMRLTNHVNVTTALEFDADVEINLNNKTIMYTATAPIEVAENATVKLANGHITFNTAKAMKLNKAATLEIADATVQAQGTIAEVVGDDAKVEIFDSSVSSTGKVVDVVDTANNFALNVEGTELETADAANVYVSTEEAFRAALADTSVESITLSTNIDVETGVYVKRNVTVNLNGKTLTSKTNSIVNGIFTVFTGATLTIEGEGKVDSACQTNDYSMAIWAYGGHVVINGGTFTNLGAKDHDGTNPNNNELIYVSNSGKVTINAGTFIGNSENETFGARYTLNAVDGSTNPFVVNGGSFVAYNPSASASENPIANFVALGYKVVESNGVYTVVEEAGHIYAANAADFAAAVANTEVESITLSTNITLTNTINLNKDLTIDLNGKTITSPVRAFNILDGEVSIDNGTINVAGDHSLYVNGTATGSDISLTLGEDLVVNSDNCAIFIKGAGAKLVTAATLTSTGPYATLSGNGNAGNEVDSITIIGGTITHATYAAIYVPQTGEFNITGGTITGTTALYVKSGIVNISGGALTGTGEYTGYVYSQNGAHFFGDALIIDACDYPGGNPVVTITGGTFTSTNAHGIGYYAFEDNTATITAAGYDIYKTTCVSTEAALVSAIADSTVSVVTLTKNITLANTVNIARDVVINLNGKTVTSSTKAFNIVDGEVSIDNGTINVAGHHSLYVDGTATGSDITLTLGEDLVVNSDNCAIFIKGAGAKLVTAATLTSTGPYATLSGNGNAGNEVDSITIIGGSITHASTMAIYVPQTGEFNITGGTITGTTALYVKSGIVNISGGTFTGTGEYTGYVYSGDGAKFFGDALIIDACGYPGGNPVVTITGGTFTTTDTDAHGIGYYTYGQNTATISAEGYEVYTENN